MSDREENGDWEKEEEERLLLNLLYEFLSWCWPWAQEPTLSVVISFLVCVPSLLSGPITSHTLYLIKNKKIVWDECTGREGEGTLGDKAFGISHWPVLYYLAAAVAVLHVVSWRQDGNDRMEKKKVETFSAPTSGSTQAGNQSAAGGSSGSWPQLEQRLVWQQLSRYTEVRPPPEPVHIHNDILMRRGALIAFAIPVCVKCLRIRPCSDQKTMGCRKCAPWID